MTYNTKSMLGKGVPRDQIHLLVGIEFWPIV